MTKYATHQDVVRPPIVVTYARCGKKKKAGENVENNRISEDNLLVIIVYIKNRSIYIEREFHSENC